MNSHLVLDIADRVAIAGSTLVTTAPFGRYVDQVVTDHRDEGLYDGDADVPHAIRSHGARDWIICGMPMPSPWLA